MSSLPGRPAAYAAVNHDIDGPQHTLVLAVLRPVRRRAVRDEHDTMTLRVTATPAAHDAVVVA